MSKNILEIKNLDFSYDEKQILKEVSLNIKESEFHVLLGLNGAGKSTLFCLITRLLNQNNDDIKINNLSIKNNSHALKDVGIVFQEPTLDLDLTVKQNLFYYGSLKGLSFDDTLESIKDEIVNLELEKHLDTTARKLNGGHRRRVEILRALINKPKLLLLDEATVGLDLKTRMDILDYIKKLVAKENISVLWITHLFDEVNEKDKVSFIKNGKIIDSLLAKEVIEKYEQKNLQDTFNLLVG